MFSLYFSSNLYAYLFMGSVFNACLPMVVLQYIYICHTQNNSNWYIDPSI